MPHQNPRREAADTALPHMTWLYLTLSTSTVQSREVSLK